MDTVKVSNLSKIYKQGLDEVYAVNQVSFCVKKGEFVAVVGQSGSGKTTLLNLIGGIEHPTSGNVWIDGVDIHTVDNSELARLRRQKIGYIFQDFNLIPILTVKENIIMPQLLDSRKVDEEQLKTLADFLGIERRLQHLPDQLSGGQKQRVAIARALINQPSIILADEPTCNIDKKTAEEIMQLLIEINSKGNTILLVTHEERYANMCHRKIVLSDGCMCSDEEN